MKTWVKIVLPSVILLIIIGFIGWRIQVGTQAKPIKTITVARQNVVKDVSFTGYAEAVQSANVAFELSGSVKSVYVSVGDTVIKGQKLASLDPQSASLQIAKAQADKASTAFSAHTAWQNAIAIQKDTNAENAKIIATKKQAVRDAKAGVDAYSNIYTQKQSETQSDDSATLTTYASLVASKAAYNSSQNALTAALLSIKTSNDAVKHAVDSAYAQYTSTQQAAQDVTGLSTLDALAGLARVTAQKNTLTAPFSGIITQKFLEAGEFASVGNPVFTIAQNQDLQISADVPETDALTLINGMTASVTFDALSSDKPAIATVTQIYPSAKSIQGVPTFHVILGLDNTNDNLRSGITANITVHAEKRDRVIAIPRRAVIKKSGKTYVTILKNDTQSEKEVTTGLIGSDGLEEITSGLAEGDVLVSP